MRLSHLPLPIAVITACFVLVNCSSRERDCTEPEIRAAGGVCTADTAGEGGTEGGTDGGFDVIAPPGCDLTKDPKDSPQCIDSAVGIFVSPTGDDSASGSKELPVRTIKRGLELASSKALPRVYVCEGTYDANVEITSPVSLYGGLSCAWAHTGAKPKIAPPKGIALRVTKVNGAVVIAEVEVVGAADPTAPGHSAIAAFVSESAGVTFRGANLSAGAGTDGPSPIQKAQASNAGQGGTPTTTTGGTGAKNTCSDGDSIGGSGGTVGANDAVAGQPALAGGQPGAVATDCANGGTGVAGTSGGKGDDGSTLGTARGVLTSTNWTPSNGAPGKNGARAQGGGGGGSRTGAGGGGGAGGCGGEGGAGGGGGGASVALVSFASTVVLEGCHLVASKAGNGGDGAPGQLGQPPGGGGNGGTGNPFNGCPGGQGGTGGNGGAGAGGAGGVSAGILHTANEPTKDSASTITVDAAGTAGNGPASNNGPAGVAAPVVKAD